LARTTDKTGFIRRRPPNRPVGLIRLALVRAGVGRLGPPRLLVDGVRPDTWIEARTVSTYGDYGDRLFFVDGLTPAVMAGSAVVAFGAVLRMWPPRTETR
jgi:hypothetical protein